MDKYAPFRNTEKINLFGVDLILSERSESDVRALSKAIELNDPDDPNVQIMALIQTIKDSMAVNNKIAWWKFARKIKVRKIISTKKLLTLPRQQLIHLFFKVRRLEGDELEGQKKKQENESIDLRLTL